MTKNVFEKREQSRIVEGDCRLFPTRCFKQPDSKRDSTLKKLLTLIFCLGLVISSSMDSSVSAQNRKAKQKRVENRPNLNRLVFPTRSRIPSNWIRYEVDGKYLYAAPEVQNRVEEKNGNRSHYFQGPDFFYTVRIGPTDEGFEPGFPPEFEATYRKFLKDRNGLVLDFKQSALNIVEFQDAAWTPLPNGGQKMVYSRFRIFILGKVRVDFSIMSREPFGPSVQTAMDAFAGTFAISDDLAEALAVQYSEQGYEVQLSHRPLIRPNE